MVLGLRRLARSQRGHCHRVAFLVDAKAVLGALKKGRSSAKTLRHPVSQAGAIALACAWKVTYAYMPSESNPADDPSRGVKRKLPRKSRTEPPPMSRAVSRLLELRAEERRLLRRMRQCRFSSTFEGCYEWPSTTGSDTLGRNSGSSCTST